MGTKRMKSKRRRVSVQRSGQRNARTRAGQPAEAVTAPAADPGSVGAGQAEGPRRNAGWFLPGNRARAQHLIYSERLPPGLEHLPATLDRFLTAQLADEGEAPEQIPARRRSLLDLRTYV